MWHSLRDTQFTKQTSVFILFKGQVRETQNETMTLSGCRTIRDISSSSLVKQQELDSRRDIMMAIKHTSKSRH